MKKIVRELRREFPTAAITTTGGGHLRLQLPNGRSVFVAKTPSCQFFLHHVRKDVKRAKRGIATPRGGQWTAGLVQATRKRLQKGA